MPIGTAIALVSAVVAATLLGGAAPLRYERFSRLFLAFSAGTLVGLALIELIPEGLEILGGKPRPHLLLVLGAFLATMLLDRLHVLHPHEHAMDEACPGSEHEHPPLGLHGAWGLVLHSALDGVALATALRASPAAAVTVVLALAAHKLADGLTTVSLVLGHHHRRRQAVTLLLANAAILGLGVIAGLVVPLPGRHLARVLLVMAGFFLYLGASDLLPSLTHPECRKRDVVATAIGIAVIAALAVAVH